jgi:hypothetical protein
MPANLAIEDRLIQEARKPANHRTKKETATAALHDSVQRGKQQDILSLFGKIEYDKSYNHKRGRSAKRV